MSRGDDCREVVGHSHLCPLPQLRGSLTLEGKHVVAELIGDGLSMRNDESVLVILVVLDGLFMRPVLPLCGVDIMHDSGQNHHGVRGFATEKPTSSINSQEISDDKHSIDFQYEKFVDVVSLVGSVTQNVSRHLPVQAQDVHEEVDGFVVGENAFSAAFEVVQMRAGELMRLLEGTLGHSQVESSKDWNICAWSLRRGMRLDHDARHRGWFAQSWSAWR
jgi:hypothetical protein